MLSGHARDGDGTGRDNFTVVARSGLGEIAKALTDALMPAAAEINRETAGRVARVKARGIQPCLVFIRVGEDPASQVYVAMKEKAAAPLGIASQTHVLPATASEGELLALVGRLNADRAVHGILVQALLPRQM